MAYIAPISIGSVTTPLLIDAGDVQIDALGTYDADGGALESVRINGREFSVATVNAALALICPEDLGAWSDDLDGATLGVLTNEAAEDHVLGWADYQNDMRGDAL